MRKLSELERGSWARYAGVLHTYAKDFELLANAADESNNYKQINNGISYCVDSCNHNGRIASTQYCNKTGQAIGVLFGTSSGIAASIAPQWLNTGPEMLKRHAENNPAAYTVYAWTKILDDVYNSESSLVNQMNKLKFKISMYEFLVNNINLIPFFQFNCFVVNKVSECDNSLYRQICKEEFFKDINYSFKSDDISLCLSYFDVILSKCFNNEKMPMPNSSDDFELLESYIAKRVRELNARRYGKTSNEITNSTIYSNFSPVAKVMSAVRVANVAKELKTNRIKEGLAGLFG